MSDGRAEVREALRRCKDCGHAGEPMNGHVNMVGCPFLGDMARCNWCDEWTPMSVKCKGNDPTCPCQDGDMRHYE